MVVKFSRDIETLPSKVLLEELFREWENYVIIENLYKIGYSSSAKDMIAFVKENPDDKFSEAFIKDVCNQYWEISNKVINLEIKLEKDDF